MKRSWLVIGAVLPVILFIVIVIVASAGGEYPDDVEIWQLPSGQWCQRIDGVFDKCYCPCEREIKYVCEPTPTPTDDPKRKPTPTNTSIPNPTPSPTLLPSATPEPICKIWVCHKPGTAAEQDYCCYDSEGCKAAHLKHGDYEGKCE